MKQNKYGYFEAKIKLLDIYSSIQSAFWLQSSKFGAKIGDPSSYGTEIDIMKYVKTSSKSIPFTIHWDGYKKYVKHSHYKIYYPTINDNKWYTFGLLLDKSSYKFYVVYHTEYKTISHSLPFIQKSTLF